MQQSLPVQKEERSQILDILRGIAILGILLNNIYGFSGYGFLPEANKQQFDTYNIDRVSNYLQIIFVEGKFYSLFSLLFGIGFSIILTRTRKKGLNSLSIFYRRLFILLLIGSVHLFFFWEGDILFLYAVIGMILPLFRNCSDKQLLTWATVLILSPVFLDLIKYFIQWDPGQPLSTLGFSIDKKNGIPLDQNFAFYLYKDGSGWNEWRNWQESGYLHRYAYILQTNRIPKVLGMFLIGYFAGRKMIFAHLDTYQSLLKKTMLYGFAIGLPFSIAMCWFEMDGRYMYGNIWGMADTISYALSVAPLSLAYASALALVWLKGRKKILQFFAPVGRMALTNYLTQTLLGIFIFYRMGLGLGQKFGLTYLFLTAIVIYFIQVVLSHLWLKYFQYGPVEWIWRQLTYGKRLPLLSRREKYTAPLTEPLIAETRDV